MILTIALAATMSAGEPVAIGTVTNPGTPQPATAPPVVNEDTPEEIARDAQRDLRDSRFYNRPGATRSEYDAEWQTCRLIARGSRTPSGTSTYVYNPAVISPLAAGIGAGIGNAIAQAIIEGQLRRANRRSCLLIRGWRLVEVTDAEQARVAALPEAERDAYFNSILGAEQVQGARIVTWNNDYAAPRLAPESEQ
jgi:hypothetical protein